MKLLMMPIKIDKVKVGKKWVGDGEEPYIIGEIGANHNGSMDLCKKIIDEAVDCRVDAVKFQSWTAKSLISEAEYNRNKNYSDTKKHFGSLREMVKKYQLTPKQHYEIASYCKKRKIEFLSSCFSPGEVDLLTEMKVSALKIASMDVNHLPLIEYAAKKRTPLILSSGMSTLGEIEQAVHLIRKHKCEVILLHCVSIYPPQYEQINLNNIEMLKQAFHCPVGFSDHTMGSAIPLAAVAKGACMIEKHFTIDKDLEGWITKFLQMEKK